MRSRAPRLFTGVLSLLLSAEAAGQVKESLTMVTIQDTPPCYCYLTISPVSVTRATSCQAADGHITVTVTGGTGDYTYLWSDQAGTTVGTTAAIQGLAPGFYYLSVKDRGNPKCAGQGYFEVGSDIQVNVTPTTNSQCTTPNGSVSVAVTGGSGSFTFTWTLPDGTQVDRKNLTNLKAGQYSLKVTDTQSGCAVSKTVTIKSSAALTASVRSNTPNTSCLSPTGAIDVTITGGSGQYKFYWYDLARGEYISYQEDLTGSRGGQYSLYVVDNVSGCVAYESLQIEDHTQAPAFTVSSQANTSCNGPFNGAINLTPSGSPGPFTVSWTNGTSVVSTQEDPTGLPAGTYGFAITDVTTGCRTTRTVSDIDAVVIQDQSIAGTGVQIKSVVPNSDCRTPNGKIDVTIESQGHPYTCTWTGPDGFVSKDEDPGGLAGGTYTLRLTMACSTENNPPVIVSSPLTPKDGQVTLALPGIVSDPDGNLDPASIEITVAPSSGAAWTLTEDQDLIVTYAGSAFTGRDYLTVKACDLLDECTEAMIYIDVPESAITVYNAVAPNSSGDNKFMRIVNLPDVTNKVSIYNRWGDKVFEVADYNNDLPEKRFAGITSHGKELPSGTYFYKIELADHRQALTGYLVLKQ